MADKIQKEKEFHNQVFSDGRRLSLNNVYKITQPSLDQFIALCLNDCERLSVLEYGCGHGSKAYALAQKGASVTGIDISDVAIEQAKNKAEELNLKINFMVANAENLEFPSQIFDRVIGTAIIHHLDIEKAVSSIKKVLKPGGECFFYEPLGHNIFINLFRKLTPSMRTEDEHPLHLADLKNLAGYFKNTEITYFHLTSLLLIPFYRLRIFKKLLAYTESLDRILFRIFPFLRSQAWIVIIKLKD